MEDKSYWRHERIAFLALTTLKGVGFRTLHKIAQSQISFISALRNPKDAGLEKHFRDAELDDFNGQKKLWEAGLSEAKKLSELKVSLLFKKELRFPQKLFDISDCPEWIFVQGKIDNLYMPAMSIVGTRKPSTDGIFLTKFVVAALANHKCVTVSGLALGIDQTAHIESIRYGIPTIAVLGTGISEDYPKGSELLRREILKEGGTVISEYLPNQSYSAENFVRRNRLQAALGDILFPTEWQIKSGTAHTVKFAHKYGKKIINLYLPLSYKLKPELQFSEKEYKALSLEIPKDTELLASLVSFFTESEQIHINDPPAHISPTDQVTQDAFETSDGKEDNDVEIAQDTQIPLL
ncbi:DNA-protecting protein DprA [Pseudomonas sp. ADAK22]|uniref:DNA-processing protein DprA n=1 Tax=Pseudomonas sp. ADAK22 TaxID=2730851 RepID=UPI001463D10D|nr:DNA-processing protein DprA [Pseudomonas sp. ADAK22]QJI15346.1 DNA-protecting protein DprA [Pseudomonas sp. ADAK22]